LVTKSLYTTFLIAADERRATGRIEDACQEINGSEAGGEEVFERAA